MLFGFTEYIARNSLNRLSKKYSVEKAIDRESLLAFTVELLSQITGFMGGEEKQAMDMFVRRHKPAKLVR